MKWLVGFVLVLFALTLRSQNTFNEIPYPTNEIEFANSVVINSDGYLTSGGGRLASQDGRTGIRLIKSDLSGRYLWHKDHGEIGSSWSVGASGSSIAQGDSGYIVAGLILYFDVDDANAALFKFDIDGELSWKSEYGGNEFDTFNGIIEDHQGNYLLVGTTFSQGDPFDRDVYVVKTDRFGNLIWENTFGGNENEIGVNIQELFNGNYLIGAGTASFGSEPFSAYLIEIDSSGVVQRQSFCALPENRCGGTALPLSDGSIILVPCADTLGDPSKLVYYVTRQDSTYSHTEWIKFLPGSSRRRVSFLNAILLSDGSIIVVGDLFINGNPSNERDGWILKLNAQGESIFERRISYTVDVRERIHDVKEERDGSIVLTGTAFNDTTIGSSQWIVKLDSNGCLVSGCDTLVGIRVTQSQPEISFALFPNPTNEIVNVRVSKEFANDSFVISLYSSNGIEVLPPTKLSHHDDTISLNVSTLLPGLYFVSISNQSGVIMSYEKLVIN